MTTLLLRSALVLAALSAAPARGALPGGYTDGLGLDLTETSGVELTDYQLRLVIDTATPIGAGTMAADASDLLFTSSDCAFAVYPHWIESGVGTASTVVWVRVPRLSAGGTTRIAMWWGNPAPMSSSSIPDTFVGDGSGAPISGTQQVSGAQTGGVGHSQRGFRFRPQVPILAVEIGKNEPTGSTRTITLFDYETQAKLYQGTVSGAAGIYSYAELPAPLWLEAGRDYLLEMYQDAGDGYYFGASPQVSDDLTYLDMRYCNSCDANTFPTNVLSGIHYGYSDFAYYKRTAVASSEPVAGSAASACLQGATCEASCDAPACGDGIVNAAAGEGCDDGHLDDGDGCSASCAVEPGWACTGSPSTCSTDCGDGVVAGAEACDSGNPDGTDGCSASCVVEPGWTCTGSPSVCSTACGDGVVAGAEACDDGRLDDGDGCSASCAIEPGWACTGSPSACSTVCGDGVVAGAEACDDGRLDDGDGCSASCAIEPGWACAGSPSVCAAKPAGGGGGGGCGPGEASLGSLAVAAIGAMLSRRRRRAVA